MPLERGPVIGAEFEDGYSHAGEPVLVANILIRRDENIEPFALGGPQEIAVAQLVPTHLEGMPHLDIAKSSPEAPRNAMVENDPQAG
jgi:hypothetical protein